jgi:hypothetical protein
MDPYRERPLRWSITDSQIPIVQLLAWTAKLALPTIALTAIATTTAFYTWQTLTANAQPLPKHGYSTAQQAAIANHANGH